MAGDCRICYDGEEEGTLIKPCKCSGTMMFVHVECLERWRATGPERAVSCPQCKFRYKLGLRTTRRDIFDVIPIPYICSSKMFLLSMLWLICSVGYLLYILTRLEDLEVKYPIYRIGKTSAHVWHTWTYGIWTGPSSVLGLPMIFLGFLAVSFDILWLLFYGFGGLVRLQLQRAEGPLAAFFVIAFHGFLLVGFVACIKLASTDQLPLKSVSKSGIHAKGRTYVLDTRFCDSPNSEAPNAFF
jgi:hypothetical protein